jgi:hypothetical protein
MLMFLEIPADPLNRYYACAFRQLLPLDLLVTFKAKVLKTGRQYTARGKITG